MTGKLPFGMDEQWVRIQETTFKNWCNEQLKLSGRSVEDLVTDMCDGVCLAALVESLQFRKIGRIYTTPTSRIQKLQNVQLALKAITDDNVKLVNVGSDDVVDGNTKIIFGIIWSLVQRYQLSGKRGKAPPKKLMTIWFQSHLPEINITNFTTDWNDGVVLHALIDHLKPGASPDWRQLDRNDRVENCRRAMVLAKVQLNIPRVISPEDFALDELSSMTYLSYFVRLESPGYYHTLNWVCKQLRTTNITNLTTDWNDGYYLCAIVNSLGGYIPEWPNLDRKKKEENCKMGLDGAKVLGVEPLISAKEMMDPNVDHLSIMSYLSRFESVRPRKRNAEKLQIKFNFTNLRTGSKGTFQLVKADNDVDTGKVTVQVTCDTREVTCNVVWSNKIATCSFVPTSTGEHTLVVAYDGTMIKGCPIVFAAKGDHTKVKLLTQSCKMKMGDIYYVKLDISDSGLGEVLLESTSPTGELRYLTSLVEESLVSASIQPKEVGIWIIRVYYGEEEVQGSPITLRVYDPEKAWLSGPDDGFVGDMVAYKGSPARVSIQDPSQISVTGEGVTRGTKGVKTTFIVNTSGVGGNVKVDISANGAPIDCESNQISPDVYEFRYRPSEAGHYDINVAWNGRPVPGSPFHPKITDRTKVNIMDDLTDRKDENDHLALDCDSETILTFNIGDAGPGSLSADVLSPDGRLPVNIRKPETGTVQVGFTAKMEGDHYIHLYWSSVPLEKSPILAYCPGPVLPVNHAHVLVTGDGYQAARATVPIEFMVDGKKAGPGIPRVRLTGVRADVDVEMRAMKYDRYKCKYAAPYPGGYLLNVEWSGFQVPGSPFKVNITNKGYRDKVTVSGTGLKGGFVGQELRAVVDTTDSGNGEVHADCHGLRHVTRCDLIDHRNGKYTLRMFPTEACRQKLVVKYDGEDVPGSPFMIPVGEPPDPGQVRVYGPGIEPGVIQRFESKFIVETFGAGAGQLSVRIRGPRSAFHVEMKRDREEERTILCRYDPEEAGKYIVMVKWSGVNVPGSPFSVSVFDSLEELYEHRQTKQGELISDYQWKEDI